MDFPHARSLFPGTASRTYLDVAARGILSTTSESAIHQQIRSRIETGGNKPAMFEAVERVRRKLAALLNSDVEEIALTKSVADGINMIAAAMPWTDQDNVVVSALEHPSNLYPWVHLGRAKGVQLKVVPSPIGECDAEKIIEAIDDQTKVVAVSSVTLAPGGVFDLQRIGRVCRQRDILFAVDAAQSIGIMHTDVKELNVDALATSTQKGLCSLYGLGVLYCNRRWAEKLTPTYLGRFSVDLGAEHEASFQINDYSLMPAAQRFEVGNHNYLAAIAVEPALDMILEIGTKKIQQHCCSLAAKLRDGFSELGFPVVLGNGSNAFARSHIVCVGQFDPQNYDKPKLANVAKLGEHLKENGVSFSIRKGMLRFSTHLYNNDSDIEQVLMLAHASV